MNMELLQNKDVLIKVLLLLVPTVAAFSVSVVYLFRSKKNNERGGHAVHTCMHDESDVFCYVGSSVVCQRKDHS